MPNRPYSALDGKTVLVADDNPHMRTLVTTLLTALARPASVVEACCGDCALEALDRRPVDLAIVDWRMDPTDGLTLVRTLRARESGHRLPVVMMSGYAEGEGLDPLREAGADQVLSKPLSLRAFARALTAATDSTAMSALRDTVAH